MLPAEVSSANWQQIAEAVNLFWLFAGLLVVTALSFLAANGTIASLLGTGQMPRWVGILRTPLSIISAIAFVMAVFVLYRAAYMAWTILRQIYPRWWV